MIKFACFSPHPPLLLPGVGEESDKKQVKKTIAALQTLAEKFAQTEPEQIIIASPHRDWGFNVPLHFIVNNFQGKIERILTSSGSPQAHFEQGRELAEKLPQDKKIALVGSGDLSHCLKQDGPYGFEPDGLKFDKALLEYLKNKQINKFLNLDSEFPEAGECGLRPFSFILGILEGAGLNWQAEVLSYEAPFGVGYLVALLQI